MGIYMMKDRMDKKVTREGKFKKYKCLGDVEQPLSVVGDLAVAGSSREVKVLRAL